MDSCSPCGEQIQRLWAAELKPSTEAKSRLVNDEAGCSAFLEKLRILSV
jgi:hypothetical protein